MKPLLLSLTLLSLLLFPHHSQTQKFPVDGIIPLQMATPPVDGVDQPDQTICTAFSIDERARLYGTAAHCISGPIKICGDVATPVFIDVENDVAVVQGVCAAPALTLGADPAVGFDPTDPPVVKVFGFMWGGKTRTYFEGKIANLELAGRIIVGLQAGPGHSGSPILGQDNRVISIMQATSGTGFSGGCLYSTLEELKPYWNTGK